MIISRCLPLAFRITRPNSVILFACIIFTITNRLSSVISIRNIYLVCMSINNDIPQDILEFLQLPETILVFTIGIISVLQAFIISFGMPYLEHFVNSGKKNVRNRRRFVAASIIPTTAAKIVFLHNIWRNDRFVAAAFE